MNLFVLDFHPEIAAKFNCDSHVRKIILEAIEMMGLVYPNNTFKPWLWVHTKSKHKNHPMTHWVANSFENFDWTLRHAYALCDEFVYRFDKNRHHKCREHLDWISSNIPASCLEHKGLTDWPRCFGKFKSIIGTTNNAVFDYRNYYIQAKRHLAVWTKRPIPEWWK